MRKFWNWTSNEGTGERILRFEGPIAIDSWFDDVITPVIFREELFLVESDVTIWINSPGGDCIAAAQIYNMLQEYQGKVTIKIDGIAASAASVIAMAGDVLMMSPVSLLMIHNPSVGLFGDSEDMKHAVAMLSEVKESIINAYERKTKLPRAEISEMMNQETWMNAYYAREKGFIDGVIENKTLPEGEDKEIPQTAPQVSSVYRKLEVTNHLMDKIAKQCQMETEQERPEVTGRSVSALHERLDLMKKFI